MTEQKRIERGLYWDRAWSLVEGCTPVSVGCANCWSAAQTHMRAAQSNPRIKARYEGLTNCGTCGVEIHGATPRFNGTVRPQWSALTLPASVKKPTTWAVWNDLFHEEVPFAFMHDAWRTMLMCSRHTFLVLTKRPDRMLRWLEYEGIKPAPNIWLGVTAENQQLAHFRIPTLMRCGAKIFVSVEPMLGPVDLRRWLNPIGLGWVICGPESGKHKRLCDPAWIKDLEEQCAMACVPFFDKSKTPDALRQMPEGV